MKRRLYFMLPDVKGAHNMMNDLLLARINANRIHFLARPDVSLGNLPTATVSEGTDLIDGWEKGMGMGAVLGLILGIVALSIPTWWYGQPLPITTTLLVCTLVGLVVGGLWTAVIATTIPNVQLKPFEKQLKQGQVLMMVQVPFHQAREVQKLVTNIHPEATYSGTWPTDHVLFP